MRDLILQGKLWRRFPLGGRLAAVVLAEVLLTVLPLPAASLTPKQMLAAGRVDEAIPTLQLQIDRDPKDAEAHNLLCRAYFELDEWDRGIPNCERARDLDPTKSQYELWLARIYGERADHVGFLSAAGLVKKVRNAFERAVELDPQSWEAHTDLAEFYLEAPGIVGGGKSKAQSEADILMRLNPAMAHWIQARLAEKNKDPHGAEAEYRAEIAASHSAARAWIDLAIFLWHANRLDEMQEALRHLETAPVDRRESLMDGASILLKAGLDRPLGIRLLQLYLTDPVEEGPAFKAHTMLGELLEQQGERKAAAAEFRAALALAHNYARAREDLNRVQR
jgi:tetratricopeptide (TPR) repeat protein